MPDNSQGRINDMPPSKRNKHKGLTTAVLLILFAGIFAVIAFG